MSAAPPNRIREIPSLNSPEFIYDEWVLASGPPQPINPTTPFFKPTNPPSLDDIYAYLCQKIL
jgi:hypothetical protein